MIGTYIFIGFIVATTLALLGILLFASDEFFRQIRGKAPREEGKTMMYAVAVLAGMLGVFIVVALMRVNGDQDLFDEGYLQGLRDSAEEYKDKQLKFDFDKEGAK